MRRQLLPLKMPQSTSRQLMTVFRLKTKQMLISGDLTITDSTVTINATDKGITVTDELTVEGNSKVTVVAGDEGLEGRYINLTGGTVDITAVDDGINATEWTTKDSADTSSLTNTTADLENEVGINIDGATVTILADGDGIDSNGNVTVKSGSLYVAQTSADNAAIDYDGTGIISGGTVWAIGNQGMAQAFTTGSASHTSWPTSLVVLEIPSQLLIVLEML